MKDWKLNGQKIGKICRRKLEQKEMGLNDK
jgi:hypothetical protein